MTHTVIHKIETFHDLLDLKTIIKGIIGKPCFRVSIAFIDELCLEFGTEITRDYPRKPIKMGEWFLTPRHNYWKVEVNGITEVDYGQEETEILSKLAVLKGLSVLDCEISFPDLGLSLLFEKEWRFVIQPSIEGDISENISYWQMFTPDKRFIEVGPGLVWSDSPADAPIGS